MLLRNLTSHGQIASTVTSGGETLGQVPLRSHQASRLQGQLQLGFYRAFVRAGTVPAWRAVRDGRSTFQQPASAPTVFSGRRTENRFQPPPSSFFLLFPSPIPLSFLSSCFSSSPFSLPFYESWYKFQSKIKMYFISPFWLWLSSVHSKDIAVSMGTHTL